jgi:thermostable 8-oxoguanine DNA glycosylase
MYLTAEDMPEIYAFKLRTQEKRTENHRKKNPDGIIKKATRAAFSFEDKRSMYEAKVRMNILTALDGFGIGLASAILALNEPEHYAIIDRRAWRALYKQEKTSFTVNDYVHYLERVRKESEEHNMTPQEYDLHLWERDAKKS